MKTNCSVTFFLTITILLLVLSCGNQPNTPTPADRILLENNESVLNHRVTYFETTNIVEAQSVFTGQLQKSAQLRLVLRAEVLPPIIDGQPLQANHVTLADDKAYVSYSTINNLYRGGVEIFDIFNSSRPFIRSQALFIDTDITIAVAENNKLFLGEATDSDHNRNFESPASLEIIDLENGRLTTSSQQADLPGFNGNDVACFDDAVFITSGSSNGALSIFKNHSLELLAQFNLEGAIAIEKTDRYILILEGTGVNLHLFDRNTYAFVKTIALGCTDNNQAKAEMAVDRTQVYISAYECGVLRVDLNTEEVRLVVAAPDGGHTNGVSLANGRLFIANGTAGLQIAERVGGNFDNLLSIRFEGSTNFVAAKGNLVFVANGSGGLKILELLPRVEDIEINGIANVRADRGQSGYTSKSAGSVKISVPGLYKVESLVWYDSGDEQKNESLYLELRDENGRIILPENPNAGVHKVVPDDPGHEHTTYRDSGTFRLSAQNYNIDVYHYAKISREFPHLLNGNMTGAESAHVRGFKLKFIEE